MNERKKPYKAAESTTKLSKENYSENNFFLHRNGNVIFSLESENDIVICM